MKSSHSAAHKRILTPAFCLAILAVAWLFRLFDPLPSTAQTKTNLSAPPKTMAEAANMDTLDDKHHLAAGDTA